MTNLYSPSNTQYKQMYCPWAPGDKKYTSTKITEEDYIAISPRWKILSAKAKERDGWMCKDCGSSIQLSAHHLHYPDVWGKETIDDLITLCDSCHKKRHRKG